MSFISDMFSSSKGTGFTAQSANVVTPSDGRQAAQTWDQQQDQYQQQRDLASALQAQGGLQNQSNTYNQLQNVSQNGSQLANAQLTGATNQGIQQAAGTVASQKGLNPALAARMAGQQAANSTQTAANQSAQLQAQTQLNALGQQASLANQQAGQQINQTNANAQSAQNMNSGVLNSIHATNTENINNVAQQNSANAAIAAGNQKAQTGIVGGVMNAVGGAAASLAHGGMVRKPYADGGNVQFDSPSMDMQAPQQAPMAPTGAAAMPAPPMQPKKTSSAIAGILKGIPNSSPGQQQPAQQDPIFAGTSALGSGLINAGQSLFSGAPDVDDDDDAPDTKKGSGKDKGKMSPMQSMAMDISQPVVVGSGSGAAMAHGGKVPAMVSPGEIYLRPREAKEVANGKKSPMVGERIPGKAPLRGDSLKNDIVPKNLDQGGVVIPKSILEGPNAHREAYKFVNAALGKHGMRRKSSK